MRVGVSRSGGWRPLIAALLAGLAVTSTASAAAAATPTQATRQLAAGPSLAAAGLATTPAFQWGEWALPNKYSLPTGVTVGADGLFYLVESGTGQIVRVDEEGLQTVLVTLPSLVSVPRQIVSGPDGNLWFTESAANKVGRLTLSGALTEFSVPTSQAVPYGIANGPDGNLWITEALAGKVAKLTPAGQFAEYPLPNAQAQPADITVGPDGNLWVAEKGTGAIARVTPAGAATEYALADSTSQPLGVVAGPDGNLWFTEASAGRVGRLNPQSGTISEFALPSPSAYPSHLTVTPDGASVAFAEQGVDSIGEMDMQGNLSTFYLEAGAAPDSVVAAPDGNLWATLAGTGAVGHLTVDVPAQPATLTPVAPFRLFDTRDGTGGVVPTPLGPGGALKVMVAGRNGIPPSGVTSAILNVTVTDTTAAGYLTVYPGGAARPLSSSLDFTPGSTVATLVQVRLGQDGSVTFYNSAGTSDVVVDVSAYTATAGAPADFFNPIEPARLLDTRSGDNAPAAPLAAAAALAVPVLGQGGLPLTGVAAVVLDVTAVNPSAAGYLSVYPDGASQPLVSNLNFGPGQVVANRVVVRLGPGGAIDFFNALGSTDLVVDVTGWYGSSGSLFVGVKPARIFDTRNGTGGQKGPLGPATTVSVLIANGGGFVPYPTSSTPPKAVVATVTAISPTAAGYLTVYPSGAAAPPTSDLNFPPGAIVSNLVIVQLSADGKLALSNEFGSVDVVVDVLGYYF